MTSFAPNPSVRRSLRIAFALIVALILAPIAGYVIEWRLGSSSVPFDEGLVAVHVIGLLAMLGWCILFLKAEPGLARTGLVVAFLLLAFWAFAIFS